MTRVRVLALTRYGALGASSRLRIMQYLPALNAAGLQVEVQALFDDETLSLKYQHGQYGLLTAAQCFFKRVTALLQRRQFDLIWIEKEALPWCPLWVEAALLQGVPYVLDYDDAVFHNYDQHRLGLVRRMFGRRLDELMSMAALVVGGNKYLAQRGKDAGAPWVELLPTVVDLDRYPVQSVRRPDDGLPRIVWIGSPSTVKYLDILHASLQLLSQRMPFVFRVVGAEKNLPGVNVECVPWAEATEVGSIAHCDVGVMPLLDSSWERGKCGYKLIQYMACGLPVVASPVGVNGSIVQEGINGYLADSDDAWTNRLDQLLTNANLRTKMGNAGRRRVEQEYCLQVTGPKLAGLLHRTAQKGGQ